MTDQLKKIAIDPQLLISESGAAIPGFNAFFEAQRDLGNSLLIMGPKGPQTAARLTKSLAENGYFDSGGPYGFSSWRTFMPASAAVMSAHLKASGISHYVGAEASFLSHPSFPADVQGLLVGNICEGTPSFADWGGVINYFTWSQGISGAVLTGVTTIKEDGDNYVYKVEQADGTRSVLKQYHSTSDVESRLDTQSKHLSILRDCGISCIPKPVWNQGSWAIYDYVPGEAPDPNDQKVIKQVSDFLAQLDTKGDELRKHNLPMADDARLTLASYVAAVNKLWAKVFSAAQAGHQDVMFFMMTDLEQLRQDNINHYYLWCKRKNWDKDHELDTKELIFSPVDFGLHNARLTPSGELVFLDLEHSGWDDPAKLLADFFYNTEQNLEMKHKLQVLDTFVKHRDWDKGFLNRFWAVSDIVAVEWILKTLAVVTKEEQKHLEATIPGLDYKAAVKQGLDEALAMREAYQPMEHLCKVDQLLGADEKIS